MNYDLATNILLSADDFYEAYRRCREGKNKRHEGSITIYEVVNIPAIANGAFACELYLKYLLNKKPKEHKLNILFAELDEECKKQILYEQTSQKLQEIAIRYRHESFEILFEEMGDIFVEWRYIFEEYHPEGFYGNRINKYLEVLEILLERFNIVAHNKELSILN